MQDKKIAAIKQPNQENIGGDLALCDHPEPKTLSDKQIEAIKKVTASLSEDKKKLDEVWKELATEKFKAYVPKVMDGKVAMVKAKMESAMVLVELVGTEKRGDSKALQEELRSTKAAMKDIYRLFGAEVCRR